MKRIWLIALAAAAMAGCNREREFSYSDEVFGGVPVTMKIVARNKAQADAAHQAAIEAFSLVNNLMSDYQPNTEISQLNKSGEVPASSETDKVHISSATEDVLRQSVHFAEVTDGAFDVTAGPIIKLWKDRIAEAMAAGGGKPPMLTRADLPTDAEIKAAKERTGYKKLAIGKNEAQIKPGMRVDVGGIAKGYAVDRAIDKLREHGITKALVDAGGDGYAMGSMIDGRPWTLPIQNPRGGEDDNIIGLRNAGYATSGDYVQYFEVDGVRYAHIVDPRTGQPARVAASVTVIAKDCTTADAMATGVSVLGPEEGIKAIGKVEGAETLAMFEKDGKLETRESPGFDKFRR